MKTLNIIVLLQLASSSLTAKSQTSLSDVEFVEAYVIAFFALLIIVTSLSIHLFMRFFKAQRARRDTDTLLQNTVSNLSSDEISQILKIKRAGKYRVLPKALSVLGLIFLMNPAQAQSTETSLVSEPGIIITLVLILIPLFAVVVLLLFRISNIIKRVQQREKTKDAEALADLLQQLDGEEIEATLLKRKAALDFRLTNNELSGVSKAADTRGLIENLSHSPGVLFVAEKRKAQKRPAVDPALANLVLWYLGSATIWLIFGTTVGEYLGIKFVSPDVDQVSWLSFGRLRPVHTNAVFWGWASLGMLGLGYYVVTTVSNCSLYSVRKGYISLILINSAVLLGSVSLMAGINNGGGEYREYTWPVMALFAAGLILTLQNFYNTIANRKTKEVYVSNWYIVSAIIFALVIAVIAYWPSWQNGLGETIIQGYYMHQGVGMWFMMFTLGLVYYFLPQQLNKPIYSYSLGILAFWTQILFYTLIGTHHFVFSAIPWWLQTVAIVGSAGMLIPVAAGTTNFFMTFKGSWSKVASTYTLPFFLIGIVFYFTGSFQGTAEAFRNTNLIWHFTDFTIAHSHLTMYGIITFLLWGCMYAVIPRLTGIEPPQSLVGVHFWLAFLGLMFYVIPLMIGGTLRGLSWMEGKPFIESVVLMAPYWLWRAIGGTMMWLSHLVFAYNFYRMVSMPEPDVKRLAIEKLKANVMESESIVVN